MGGWYMRIQAFLVSFLLILNLFITPPAIAKRIALVIGNDDYANVTKLQKAVNDAKAVSNTIRDIGFEVIESLNANRRTFDQQLNNLNTKVNAGDEVLFFFAGHGISVKGRNFLLPVDIPKITPGQERSVIKEAFSEDEIISLLQERGAKVSLLIIDACRNNPFPKEGTRSVGRSVGLGQRSTPPRNTFVMYSAGFGQEALDRLSEDDQNPNSIFTRKLLPLLKTPGLSHIQMAKQLQIEVEQLALTTKSKHQQFPAFYDQVRGDFFLVPGKKDKAKTIVTPSISADETLWKTIENSNKASDFEFYLREYPKGRYSSVAKLKLQQLKETEVAIGNLPKSPDVNIKRSYNPGDSFKDCNDCPEMIVVPRGSFMMGSPKSEKDRDPNEGPLHKVTITKKFAVGKFEITRGQFDNFIKETGHNVGNECVTYENGKWKNRYLRSYENPGFIQDDLHPVTCINWDDAKAYVKWLNKKVVSGHKKRIFLKIGWKPYRLLSEAEWEYVARAKTQTPYWWGNSVSIDKANYNGTKNKKRVGKKIRNMTFPVESFEANEFGLYNIHGNVNELVEDCYSDSYRGAPSNGKAWIIRRDFIKGGFPRIRGNCIFHTIRGGSWYSGPNDIRSASRSVSIGTKRVSRNGFRVFRRLSR